MRDRKIKPRDKRFIVVQLTRTPSLPYSTPRAPNSRVFFTMSTSSLMAEKTLHTKGHNTLGHTLITPYTHLLTHLLHTYFLHTLYTPSSHLSTSHLIHTFLHTFFTLIYFTPSQFMTIYTTIHYTPIYYAPYYFTTFFYTPSNFTTMYIQ